MAAAVLTLLALALLFTLLLEAADRWLAVPVDPLTAELLGLLPGANCGNCGHGGCAAFAAALGRGESSPDRCTVGGPPVAARLAAALGLELPQTFPVRPVIHCGATRSQRLQQGRYLGPPRCSVAHVVSGVQGCTYGCLGLADCVRACEYDAMEMVEGLPRIDYQHCIGCGACVAACPRGIIEQIPFKAEQMLVVACASRDPGKVVRQVCEVGCIGCQRCAREVPELFRVEEDLARIDYAAYDPEGPLAQAQEVCPMKSMLYFGAPVGEVAEMPEEPKRASAQPLEEDLNWRG